MYDSFLKCECSPTEKNIENLGNKKAEPFTKGSGDFTDCMDRIVPAAKPDDPEAFCADYEHRQTGSWPGEKRASIHRDTFLDGPVEKIGWTDEARAASAAARAHGYSSNVGTLNPRVGTMLHPSGNKVTVNTDGSWQHESTVRSADQSGDNAAQLKTHLAAVHGAPPAYTPTRPGGTREQSLLDTEGKEEPERTATGLPPGTKWDPEPGYHDWPLRDKAIHRDTFLDGPVEKIGWTDAARAASAAARAAVDAVRRSPADVGSGWQRGLGSERLSGKPKP